jgi:two-component system sensor histidine kinase YesM
MEKNVGRRVRVVLMNIYSLRFKLIGYFLILILLPLFVVSFFTYRNSTHIIEQKISESFSNSLFVLQKRVDDILQHARYAATPFLIDSHNLEFVQKTINPGDYDDLMKMDDVMRQLQTLKLSDSNIYSISLYDINDRMVLTSEKKIIYGNTGDLNKFNNIIENYANQNRWFLDKWPVSTYLTYGKNLLTYPIPLDPSDENRQAGYLLIHISEDTISEYVKQLNLEGEGSITFILDRDGTSLANVSLSQNDAFSALFGKKPRALEYMANVIAEEQGSYNVTMEGQHFLVVSRTSESTGFKYVTLVPKNHWNREILALRNGLVVIAILTVVAALLLALLFMRNIYRPMHRLLKAMNKSVDIADFNYQIEEQRKDEFGVLFSGFNSMIRRIQLLIKNLYQERLLKQEMELKLMQSRMNPHFLYNTLNSIYSIAKLSGLHEVTDMTYSLSNFFRLSLRGGDWITVKEMLHHLDYYLRIQKIRYRGRFEMTTDVEDELLDVPILKLLLQPLVENAIIHGLETKEGKGNITIVGYREGEHYVLSVSDDGLGMEETKLEEIRHALSLPQHDGDMFALHNVQMRIKHYYGPQYGLEIYSAPLKGTTVEITLPVSTGREKHV